MAETHSIDLAGQLEELQEVLSCCEYLMPIAEASARPGNAPELVLSWLEALAVLSRQKIEQTYGGMGVITPMQNQKVSAGNSANSRS